MNASFNLDAMSPDVSNAGTTFAVPGNTPIPSLSTVRIAGDSPESNTPTWNDLLKLILPEKSLKPHICLAAKHAYHSALCATAWPFRNEWRNRNRHIRKVALRNEKHPPVYK